MKYAFLNTDNMLTSWGYQESNNEDRRVGVDDDFDLEPGKWQLNGESWDAFEAPPPVPTEAEVLADRDGRLALATLRIAPLQDAVDLDDATAAEKALLKTWKQYRVALSRIEQQAGFPLAVEWPEAPN